MPTKPVKRFTAWSYSRLGDYNQCPLRARLKHLDRLPEPGSPAMDRGKEVHDAAAKYITGEKRTLSADLKLFKKELAALRKAHAAAPMLIERQWAFTATWHPADWFGKDAWCRMVLDLAYVQEPKKKAEPRVLHIIDYKTGRVRAEEQRPQLSLYALGGFLTVPEVQQVSAHFWYLDHGEVISETFELAQLSALKKEWQAKVVALFKDTKFAPRPSDKCRWCHYGKAKAGLCPY